MLEFSVMLLGVKPWKMTDEQTGEIREGVSCHYINLDSPIDSDRGKGFEGIKQTLPMAEYGNVKDLAMPCLATMRATIQISSNNTKVKPVSFKLIEAVTLKAG